MSEEYRSIMPTPATPIPPVKPGAPHAKGSLPPAVTVIGIVFLVFAAWGAFQSLGGMFLIAFLKGMAGDTAPSTSTSPIFTLMWIGIAVSAISASLEAISGIGLLCRRPWARKGALVTIGIVVLIGILTAIIMHFVIASDVAAGASAPAATSPFWRIHGATSSLLGWAAYGVMVYFLCQPNVVEAFEGVEDKRRISY